jgi:hypothetical protein
MLSWNVAGRVRPVIAGRARAQGSSAEVPDETDV